MDAAESSVSGANPVVAAPDRWRRLDYDVNGEWSYYLILDEFLKDANLSKRAAAGWAGDHYAIYENPKTAQSLLTHASEWDTASDAREFFDAYLNRTIRRYPGATEVPGDSEVIRRWRTSEGEVVVELRGTRVVVLEGIPSGLDAKALLDMI